MLIRLKIQSFENHFIDSSLAYFEKISKYFNGTPRKLKSLPKNLKKILVLRSPHIHKKSREQFQIETVSKIGEYSFQNVETATLFVYFVKKAQIPGVQIQIYGKTFGYLSESQQAFICLYLNNVGCKYRLIQVLL